MGKTFQYALVSLLIGVVYLVQVKFIPLHNQRNFYCAVVDIPPTTWVCGNALNSEGCVAGEKIFKSLCASCHKLNAKLIGPALVGVEQRWTDAGDYQGISGREWLKRYIRNWQDPVNEGHPYASQIINFDASAMTQFPHLSMDDIDSLLIYLQSSPIEPAYLPVVYD